METFPAGSAERVTFITEKRILNLRGNSFSSSMKLNIDESVLSLRFDFVTNSTAVQN